MPKQLQKSLQDYLSKIKKTPIPQIHLPSKTIASSTNWILRGCKHPKTPSFAVDHNQNEKHAHDDDDDDAATLSDVDRFLFENFKSLYQKDNLYEENREKKGDNEEKSSGVLFESPRFMNPPPDLCGSNRFFVASSLSGSLMEEARTSVTTSEDTGSTSTTTTTLNNSTRDGDDAKEVMGADDFIAVLTYSPIPYDDFRRSMQEMIEARVFHHGKVNWEFMEELLFCYLNLNDKKSYKYILRAFVDLIVVLRENSGKIPAGNQNVQSEDARRKKRGD